MPAKRPNKRSRNNVSQPNKRSRNNVNRSNPFDHLHDDLLISIMAKLLATASTPTHFMNAMLTCRRFCSVAKNSQVLAHASAGVLAVKASKWSEGAHLFMKKCADAGSLEACYTLGMIQFYCLKNRVSGVALMAKAAIASHPVALYSLAVIQFNGSGDPKRDKNLKAGVFLCAKAAALGHIDAIRELGHCLQDGYGIKKNVIEGRRFLVEANAREAEAAAKESSPFASSFSGPGSSRCKGNCPSCHLQYQSYITKSDDTLKSSHRNRHSENRISEGADGLLLSDFGCNVPPAKPHLANVFLVDWFSIHIHCQEPGLNLCSYPMCGRLETRRHEFRRCSACSSVSYCSRACQALDWKTWHRQKCTRHW